MARNDWELVDEDEGVLDEGEEDEEDEEQDEDRRVCGDRILSDEDRRRWYDDASDPEELTGFLSW